MLSSEPQIIEFKQLEKLKQISLFYLPSIDVKSNLHLIMVHLNKYTLIILE